MDATDWSTPRDISKFSSKNRSMYIEGWNKMAEIWNNDLIDPFKYPFRGLYRRDGYDDCRRHILRRQLNKELNIKVEYK